jgi:tetratricopeptide (TPR) repeat protein
MRRTFGTLLPAVLAVAGVLLSAPGPAFAAIVAPEETPEGLYDEGVSAYRIGDYEAAVEKWERAYALSDNALLLYNISLAYKGLYTITQDLSDLRRARAVIDNFITVANANPDVDVDDAVEKRDELDAMIAAAEEAEAADRPQPPAPRVVDKGGEPKPFTMGDDPGRKLRIAGIATMGGGGLLALTGGGLALFFAIKGREFRDNLARDNRSYEDSGCTLADTSAECRQLAANIDHWRTSGREANNLAVVTGAVLGGLGVAALIAGGLVYNEGNKRTKLWEKGVTSGRLRLLPARSGLVLTGRF